MVLNEVFAVRTQANHSQVASDMMTHCNNKTQSKLPSPLSHHSYPGTVKSLAHTKRFLSMYSVFIATIYAVCFCVSINFSTKKVILKLIKSEKNWFFPIRAQVAPHLSSEGNYCNSRILHSSMCKITVDNTLYLNNYQTGNVYV